ncbi:MAG: hypothetical protein J6C53_01935 [Clostridia bacterium]|nr:hypothetical protein [Clostridia bacterium]
MKEQNRDSFVFKKRWLDAISVLDEASQLEIFKALAQFGLSGEMPADTTPVCHALLISFSAEIQYNDAKYKASIENGKKGGRPTQNLTEEIATQDNPSAKIENPTITQDNPSSENENPAKPNNNLNKPSVTQPKPSKTQRNPTETQQNPDETLYDYVYVNEYVNVFSQSQSNITARTREVLPKSEKLRNFWKSRFADFWVFGITPERDKLGIEVIDTLIEALLQASSAKKLTYNKVKYGFVELMKYMLRLTDKDLGDTVWSLQTTEDIQSRPHYILGCLINRAQEAKGVFNVAKPIRDFEALLNEQAEHGKERP